MPFIFNFENSLNKIKEIKICPRGWKENIIIEYCEAQAHKYDTMISICWRVKGTTHTFTIYENKLNQISNGDYAKHFTEILENFRKEYISWFKEEKYKNCEWKWEYKKQYGKFINE